MEEWKSRLKKILEGTEDKSKKVAEHSTSSADTRYHIIGFIENAVVPAFRVIKKELEDKGREVVIDSPDELEKKSSITVSITIYNNNEEEFFYSIRGRPYQKMSFAFPYHTEEEPKYCKAEVVLRSGVQQSIDIEKYSKEDIIHNFLDEYSKWAKF
ncbi:MAG: hypothetical protein ACLFMM_07660 [Methanohalobium sp.]|uniref:hypothetical protein n=1 Tax=Methanohalobium sp. TaxID=2837493 RepID=UPI00397D9FC8